jgi:hypothetical protein
LRIKNYFILLFYKMFTLIGGNQDQNIFEHLIQKIETASPFKPEIAKVVEIPEIKGGYSNRIMSPNR